MEKLKKQFNVSYNLEWAYGIKITKLREDLDAIEKLGATHINIDSYERYGSSYIEVEAKCERFETDQEFEHRVNEVRNREERTIENKIGN